MGDSWKLICINQSRIYNFLLMKKIQKCLILLQNSWTFLAICHLQVKSRLCEEIFLYVNLPGIIIPWLIATPSFCWSMVLNFFRKFMHNEYFCSYFIMRRALSFYYFSKRTLKHKKLKIHSSLPRLKICWSDGGK